ncbi:MAG TPA: RlpA-like double-psi beta-barrel domain-containing protein [Novosphingobium sp.]|nr:RlpA-like double-psi beta-barrel domain-containing protein [Novosphingobium sp.]
MRLSVDHVRQSLTPLAALALLAGCASGGADKVPLASAPLTGPAADYPMVLGQPFTIGTVTYTPEDKLNYDAVGAAVVGTGSGPAVSGAHRTLPLPSYAEVTALDSGRTILVRLSERGPMRNDALIALSPGAAAQLGIPASGPLPVRVRRVNPGEQERALLRAGGEAPARMDTPQGLLKVLKRKLAEQDAKNVPSGSPAAIEAPPKIAALPVPTPTSVAPSSVFEASFPAGPTPLKPDLVADPVSVAPKPPAKTALKPKVPAAASATASGQFQVQAATFSTDARAQAAARAVGGRVTKSGKYWYMRLGPYASEGAAKAGLEKARSAGYKDARITRSD